MKTNNLKHTITTNDTEGNPMTVKIRLNDECGNGHQDFAITADVYEKGKPKIDKYFIMGGCCHEEILKVRPDLKIFVDLHLCDYLGIPMHPTANGFYFLREGFNNTPADSPKFRAEYGEYYRITGNQFDVLKTSKNEIQYYLNLVKLAILDQWKVQADKAIKLLEEMTGNEFLVDSKRSQLVAPTAEMIEEELKRQRNNYYSPEAEAERERAKQGKILAKLATDRDKDINKATEEFEVKKQVLLIGGEKALQNIIYYNHTRTLAFNWRSYDKITDELYNRIADTIKLPEGVQIENQKGVNH